MNQKPVRVEPRTKLELTVYGERVPAGDPFGAEGHAEEVTDLNELCIKNPVATYLLRATGDSMINAGIHPGCVLVVDCSVEAEHDDIVIAALDGEFTVKRLCLKPELALLPENPRYQPIKITSDMQFEVFGVVTNAITKFR